MHIYYHKVKYYETDKMGISHHSNYIRWMEEAKMDYLEALGFSMENIEATGVTSPVIGVECQYKHTTTFSDNVRIEVELFEYTGVKINLSYKMYNDATGALVATGKSSNCYIDEKGNPISVRKAFPEFDAKLKSEV